MNQRGFATLEVILMVMVIGILASIAIPRFTNVTAAANTAKIQSDLATIDTAIAVYQMEYGSDPSNISALVTAKYLQAEPTPPSGKCYFDNKTEPDTVPGTGSYDLSGTGGDMCAVLGNKKASDFYIPKKTPPSQSS